VRKFEVSLTDEVVELAKGAVELDKFPRPFEAMDVQTMLYDSILLGVGDDDLTEAQLDQLDVGITVEEIGPVGSGGWLEPSNLANLQREEVS